MKKLTALLAAFALMAFIGCKKEEPKVEEAPAPKTEETVPAETPAVPAEAPAEVPATE